MADENAPVPGWNAHRRTQDPLRPPGYLFDEVPKCAKLLKGSTLMEIRDRDQFKECMAEMLLLCREALRRNHATADKSKPLSLEYIADRLDVDDPCFGYLVRSRKGHLQGFLTVTTFTNWQKNFRWDSLHELAFYYDESDSEDEDEESGVIMRKAVRKERQVDRDGKLAKELQQSVRLGDPYNEGIVWPRIAEISLLGALGCGRILVKLMIEHLEGLKGTGSANYDYVALQATDNSIPFYESLGFVRVGGVTRTTQESTSFVSDNGSDDNRPGSSCSTETENSDVSATPLEDSSSAQVDGLAQDPQIVSSAVVPYEVVKAGEKVLDVAKKLDVCVWDVIFLNKDLYGDINPYSRLIKGTLLHIPAPVEEPSELEDETSPTKWFVAKENDTPKKIATMFQVPCNMLVKANLRRLPGLQATSRLKGGTRVKVSNLTTCDEIGNPYCHWSFPDDAHVEAGEPSYMMIYKLARSNRNRYPVLHSLKTKLTPYEPAKLLLEAPEKAKFKTLPIKLPTAPIRPPEPHSGSDIYKEHQRDLHPEWRSRTKKMERLLDERWSNLSQAKQKRYNDVASEGRKHWDHAMEQYEVAHSFWKEECEKRRAEPPTLVIDKEASLFEKIVQLRDDALEGQEYKYWFVLTYIPDLKWCHLAPVVQDGFHGPEKKKSAGRPKYRLVDEKLCKEIDMSSVYCIPVKAKALRRTVDADKEEWDILEQDGSISRGDSSGCSSRPIRKQTARARSAAKPMNGSIQPIRPARISTSQQENMKVATPSPSRRRSPFRSRSGMSPNRRRGFSPRASPRWSSPTPAPASRKRKHNETATDMDPQRKRRVMPRRGIF